MNLVQKLKSSLIITISGTALFTGICIYKNNEKFYNNVIMPCVHKLDPELTHRFAVFVNKYKLLPKSRFADPDTLKVKAFNKEFSNPIGIAAGFDKHGEAVQGLFDLGFGFVEIGSVTPKPQSGNPKPRVFRLSEDRAVINRYGFNSDGHDAVYDRLVSLKPELKREGVIGVNLGKNKDSSDPVQDYVDGVKKFANVADYLVINISSPNTPGLRTWQTKQMLEQLLKTVIETRDNLKLNPRPPILLKLAPDLTKQERKDIAFVLKKNECRVDGLIISNTTIDRPITLQDPNREEAGGLSGEPLRHLSTDMIKEMYELTNGLTIIGAGGVSSGQDAYEKIKAGASLIQLYTVFIYQGPPCVTRIKRELNELIQKDGYNSVTEVIGAEAKI